VADISRISILRVRRRDTPIRGISPFNWPGLHRQSGDLHFGLQLEV
jgi:hypothetical protein